MEGERDDMKNDLIYTVGSTVTELTKGDYIKFVFFFVSFVMVIILGWFATLRAFEGEWTWHPSAFYFIVHSVPGAVFLWLLLPIIFEVLTNVLFVVLLPILYVFSFLFLSSPTAFSFATTVFRSKTLSASPLRSSMSRFFFGRLTKLHIIARCTQTLSIMGSFPITTRTFNNLRHTVVSIL